MGRAPKTLRVGFRLQVSAGFRQALGAQERHQGVVQVLRERELSARRSNPRVFCLSVAALSPLLLLLFCFSVFFSFFGRVRTPICQFSGRSTWHSPVFFFAWLRVFAGFFSLGVGTPPHVPVFRRATPGLDHDECKS